MSYQQTAVIEKEIEQTQEQIASNVQELESATSALDSAGAMSTLLSLGQDAALSELERATRKAGDSLAQAGHKISRRAEEYPIVLAGLGLLTGYLLLTYDNSKGQVQQ